MQRAWVKIIAGAAFIMLMTTVVFAAPSVRIDMDADTAGYQDSIMVNPGGSFTSNVEVVLNGSGDSLSSFGFSLWWDASELNTPLGQDIATLPLTPEWVDYSYMNFQSPYLYNLAQLTMGNAADGPLTAVVASIRWTATNVATNGSVDIMPGQYVIYDEAYDKNYAAVTPAFTGGRVNLAPEPVSAVLFLSGCAFLGLRRFIRRNSA